MKTIVLPVIDAGGGHRATANALLEIFRRKQCPWHVEILSVDEMLQPIDLLYWFVGIHQSSVYNFLLRRGWTFGSSALVPMMHAFYKLMRPAHVRLFRRQFRKLRPDYVLSVVPHLNRAMFEAARKEAPEAGFATLLTDFADDPPSFWIEPQPQDYICGTERAVEQARTIAGNEADVWPVSGMVLHPKFYDSIDGNRAEERTKLGLDPARPVGLVMFGGYGASTMRKIAKTVARSGNGVQLILLCGRNRRLYKSLRALRLPGMYACEFTHNVAYYAWLSDFFIGKPGPGAISEALVMGLPVILKDGLATMAHERYNIEWVREKDVGVAVKRIRDVPAAIDEILAPENYTRMRQSLASLNLRAVFEVTELLEKLVNETVRAEV
jgi:hypothetical protein